MSAEPIRPDNYIEPPNWLNRLFPPPDPASNEVDHTLAWLKYLWTGPNPNIEVDPRIIYPHTRFSAQAIYQSIIEAVEKLKVPGVKYGPQILHESGRFSAFRAYLSIRREFSEFVICAAPVGESYLLSVRKIDHFPHVKWFHYLPVFVVLGAAFGWGMTQDGLMGGFLVMGIFLSLIWSIFRYAAQATMNWFSRHLPEIPIVGPLYLRWFRPDTFYRQDVHGAFVTLIDVVVKQLVTDLEQAQVLRPSSGSVEGPVRRDLHAAT